MGAQQATATQGSYKQRFLESPLSSGLGTRMSDTYIYVVFRVPRLICRMQCPQSKLQSKGTQLSRGFQVVIALLLVIGVEFRSQQQQQW